MHGALEAWHAECSMHYIFTLSMQTGHVPSDWVTANVTPVFKKGNRNEPSNYRPISLTSVPCKIMEHIIYRHIMDHLDSNSILVNYQHGFRQGHSCETQLITVIESVARNLDLGQQSDLLLLDFSKAFDTVPHQRLLNKLDFYGIRGNLKTWFEQWLTTRHQRVLVNGVSSSAIPMRSGVPQGTMLGPLMFLLYINDIGENMKAQIGLFADDAVLYGVIKNVHDAESLQQDLNTLVHWAVTWQMSFNAKKCTILRISCSKSPIKYQYIIHGEPLEAVEHHKYLGVDLSSDLNWNNHIAGIIGKANRSLGFIRRNLNKCPENVKEQAYLALVRPQLEYGCCAWDPHIQKQIKDIESIQKRAARFVKNEYSTTPGTVTNLLNVLKWPPLQKRRKVARLTMMFQVVSGQSAVQIPSYITQKKRQGTRQFHPKKFIEVGARTNKYKHSFLAQTIRDWNSLPNHVIEEPSVEAFKKAVMYHI